MKKKILLAMMLCVCVFGLTGCNNTKTLDEVLKDDQGYLDDYFIDSFSGIYTEMDISGDEINFTVQDEIFENASKDEKSKKELIELIEFFYNFEYFGFAYYQIELGIVNEIANQNTKYNGDFSVIYNFQTPSGEDFHSLSFNKDGLIKDKK